MKNANYRKLNDRTQNSSTYHKKDGTHVRAKLKKEAEKEIEDSKKMEREMDILEELNIKQAHRFAINAKERLKRSDTDALREQIAETARSCGHKDVWVSVFKDDNDMVFRLV